MATGQLSCRSVWCRDDYDFQVWLSPGPLFSRRGVTATMAPGRGRSSLSSALVVLTSGAAGDLTHLCRRRVGQRRHQLRCGPCRCLAAGASCTGDAGTPAIFGGAVGTDWWCTGFIAHLPCGFALREAVARIGAGSALGFPSSRRPVPDGGVWAHVRRGGGVFGESPSSAGSGSVVPLSLASAAARPPRRVRTPGPTVAGPRGGTKLGAGSARRGGRW